ncbi:hypothetical protein [Autumnicola musiva]|uniref:Uncharacterized protein n=1 Tax=Autumnicola musiva TaxID=3075589 RepID=A0ABU3D347_9FLAO|nr:hypothetical protein [Zunongwangia sp. F117]MDT0675958.1 hypothetical protein [Zunongwangia sp. F117]
MQTEIFKYNIEEYNFPQIMRNLLEIEELSQIKAEAKEQTSENNNSLYKNMEQTLLYRRLYDKLNSEEGEKFYQTFHRFIKHVIRPQYKEGIYYQEKPSHRFLYRNAEGVSRFHRDKDYGHNEVEINYFVPLTNAFDTNSLWIESEEGKEDFNALNLKPGEFARFKGVNLMHGAKNNTTGKTRISFDFRIIQQSDMPEEVKDTTNWEEKDKENPLFNNAHNFAFCS